MTKFDEDIKKFAYDKHLHRIRCARTLINNKSPKINAAVFVNITRINGDLVTYLGKNQYNAELLKNITNTLRTKGEIETFVRGERLSNIYHNIDLKQKRVRQINKENISVGQRLCRVKQFLHTINPETVEEQEQRIVRRRAEFVMPTAILKKYSALKVPEDIDMARMLLRPKLFMDFEVENVRPLGRVIIQLYTEASPNVVLEFMRFCETRSPSEMHFARVFPELWMQCEMPIDKDSKLAKPLEYDMRALNHSACSCILSYNKCYVQGFPNDKFNYTISFKKIDVLNGEQIAFGRVYNGIKIIQCIQDYGSKNGKLSKGIIISNFGIFR